MLRGLDVYLLCKPPSSVGRRGTPHARSVLTPFVLGLIRSRGWATTCQVIFLLCARRYRILTGSTSKLLLLCFPPRISSFPGLWPERQVDLQHEHGPCPEGLCLAMQRRAECVYTPRLISLIWGMPRVKKKTRKESVPSGYRVAGKKFYFWGLTNPNQSRNHSGTLPVRVCVAGLGAVLVVKISHRQTLAPPHASSSLGLEMWRRRSCRRSSSSLVLVRLVSDEVRVGEPSIESGGSAAADDADEADAALATRAAGSAAFAGGVRSTTSLRLDAAVDEDRRGVDGDLGAAAPGDWAPDGAPATSSYCPNRESMASSSALNCRRNSIRP